MAESRRTGPGRSRLTWLVVATVGLVRVAAAYAVVRGSGPEPMPTVDAEPTVLTVSMPDAAGTQRLMVPTAEVLADADLAFDGEVVEAGRTVTLILGVRFEEGGRYLVAATDGTVMACGLSGLRTPLLARLCEMAFRRPRNNCAFNLLAW